MEVDAVAGRRCEASGVRQVQALAASIPFENRKFGKLRPVRRFGLNKHRQTIWLFECDCGREWTALKHHVLKEKTKQCGYCRYSKHGLTREFSETYSSYRAMIARCYDKKNKNYNSYGAKGVKVYFDWLGDDGFQNFLRDMGPRPENLTIDRKDPFGDYEPDNCRWATDEEQKHNKRDRYYGKAS